MMSYFQDHHLDIFKILKKLIIKTLPDYRSCSAESICENINKTRLYQLYLEKIFPENPRVIKQALIYWTISKSPELTASRQLSVFWNKKTELVLWRELAADIIKNPTNPLIEFYKDWRRLFKSICLTKNIELRNPSKDDELVITHDDIRRSYANCRFTSSDDKSNVAWACTLFMIGRKWICGNGLDRRKCGRKASANHKWVSLSLKFLEETLCYIPTHEERNIIEQLRIESENRHIDTQKRVKSPDKSRSRKKRKIIDNYTKYTYIHKASPEFISQCKSTIFLFVIENPKNYLIERPFMAPLRDKVWDVSMCMFGKKYSKPSSLFNNINLEEDGNKICGCGGVRCRELIERNATKHNANIGHNQSISCGQHELMLRCEIPQSLAELCIKKALKLRKKDTKRQLFVIDICSGWQSIKKATDAFGNIKYIGVDIDHIKNAGNNLEIHTDFVVDLSDANFYDVVNSICLQYDLLLSDLVMFWASPPCTTYCHLMNVNRSQGSTSHRILSREHKDYLEPLPGNEGDMARRHDKLIANLLEFLNISKQQNTSVAPNKNYIGFLQELNSSKEAQDGLLKLMNLYTSTCARFNVSIGPINLENHASTGPEIRTYNK